MNRIRGLAILRGPALVVVIPASCKGDSRALPQREATHFDQPKVPQGRIAYGLELAWNRGMRTETMPDIIHLCARDVMRTQVVTLSPLDSIHSALATFEDHRIGGAPVTDEDGKVVGVLTLSDVARTEHLSGDRIRPERGTFEMSEVAGEEDLEESDPDEVFFAKNDYSAEVAGEDRVGDWMTQRVVTVAPQDRLSAVCAKMVKHQIHRVFVVDDERVVGIISSFDVVRCVAGTPRTPRRASRAAD
jgi:CBS domain-containing protein